MTEKDREFNKKYHEEDIARKFEEKQIQNSEYLVTHTHKHANEVSKILNFNPKRFKIIPHGICVEQINHEKTTNSSTKDPSLFKAEFACAIVNFSSSIAERYLISEVTFPLTTFL